MIKNGITDLYPETSSYCKRSSSIKLNSEVKLVFKLDCN